MIFQNTNITFLPDNPLKLHWNNLFTDAHPYIFVIFEVKKAIRKISIERYRDILEEKAALIDKILEYTTAEHNSQYYLNQKDIDEALDIADELEYLRNEIYSEGYCRLSMITKEIVG